MNNQIPITYLIYQADRAIHIHLNRVLQENGFPILIEQWAVLMEIFYNNGITQQELADRIKKNKTTLTRTLNSLEKNSLIERRNSLDDKRKKQLFHTRLVEVIEPDVVRVLRDQNEMILRGLDSATEDNLRKGVSVILENLNWEFNFLDKKYLYK